jgi:CheY-like chemotaxis protein
VPVDGDRGLAIALAWKPDVVFLDLALPRLHGDEVARRIIAACGSERPLLIAISGYASDVEREIASAGGFRRLLAQTVRHRPSRGRGLWRPSPDEIVLSRRTIGLRR